MSVDSFCCPVCKQPLTKKPPGFCCVPCGREFPVVDGIPDFFISETEKDYIDEPNKTWLDLKIVAARDTIYRLCARELRGMAFCMHEIGKRTNAGCRILEVGMGTGHFTRWLAEVSPPGTGIYAFDFSWPIIEKAKANTQDLPEVVLLRANARGLLPFKSESFDIVLVRLAPLGAHGIPNVQAGYGMLRPGGWYFGAGWEQPSFETPPTEWALQHGYESAQLHVWQYWRTQTDQEQCAIEQEQERLAAQLRMTGKAGLAQRDTRTRAGKDGSVQKMTHEHLLIGQKPS